MLKTFLTLKNSRTMLNMWKIQLFGRENKDKNGRAFPSRGRSAAPRVKGATAPLWVKGNALCLPLMRATSSHSVSVIFLLLKFPLLQNSLLACSAFRFMSAILFLLIHIMRYPALFLCQLNSFHTQKKSDSESDLTPLR